MRLYHRTNDVAALNPILKHSEWHSFENTKEAFFSTEKSGQNEGYGKYLIEVNVPEDMARLDDEFPSGEQHYAVLISFLATVQAYLVED